MFLSMSMHPGSLETIFGVEAEFCTHPFCLSPSPSPVKNLHSPSDTRRQGKNGRPSLLSCLFNCLSLAISEGGGLAPLIHSTLSGVIYSLPPPLFSMYYSCSFSPVLACALSCVRGTLLLPYTALRDDLTLRQK